METVQSFANIQFTRWLQVILTQLRVLGILTVRFIKIIDALFLFFQISQTIYEKFYHRLLFSSKWNMDEIFGLLIHAGKMSFFLLNFSFWAKDFHFYEVNKRV